LFKSINDLVPKRHQEERCWPIPPCH
jgi:hypothetical protein